MAEQEKSRIESVNVSLGAKAAHGNAPRGKSKDFAVLVCSDLGFRSSAPLRVRASEWDDFIGACGAVFRGTAETRGNEGKVFVEYALNTMKNLSLSDIARGLPHTADLVVLGGILQGLLDGTTGRDDAAARLSALKGRGELYDEARAQIGVRPVRAGSTATPPRMNSANPVDRILSSLDLAESAKQGTGPDKTGFVDQIVSASVGGAGSTVSRPRIERILCKVRQALDEEVALVLKQPFFSAPRASWHALWQCIRIAGRSRDVSLWVYSAPLDEMADALEAALATFGDVSPACVAWDYPVTFSTAHMNLLEHVAETAEKHTSMIVANLDMKDEFVRALGGVDTARPLFDEPRMIPFRRLRGKTCARVLALCAPELAVRAGNNEDVAAGASWFVLAELVRALVNGESPFDLSLVMDRALPDTPAVTPARGSGGITGAVAAETAAMGLNILCPETLKAPGMVLRTAISEEIADKAYTCFGYNLFINYLSAACARYIAQQRETPDRTDVAGECEGFLVSQLEPFRILVSHKDIQVRTGGSGKIVIDIDSAATIGGCAIKTHMEFDT